MNTPLTLAGFGLGLAAAFGAALGIGSAIGPIGSAAASSAAVHESDTTTDGGHGAAHEAPEADLPAGLTVSDRGYTLGLSEPFLPAGTATPVAFRILGPEGEAVTRYDVDHDVDLHLIAVRRDLTVRSWTRPAARAS
jgi:hypothetical protein